MDKFAPLGFVFIDYHGLIPAAEGDGKRLGEAVFINCNLLWP